MPGKRKWTTTSEDFLSIPDFFVSFLRRLVLILYHLAGLRCRIGPTKENTMGINTAKTFASYHRDSPRLRNFVAVELYVSYFCLLEVFLWRVFLWDLVFLPWWFVLVNLFGSIIIYYACYWMQYCVTSDITSVIYSVVWRLPGST